jgi:hypothetical protein
LNKGSHFNHSKHNFPKIILINARSVQNKLGKIEELITTHDPTLVAVTETWINENNFSESDLSFRNNFNVINCPRQSKNKGGGCAILSLKTISLKLVHSSSSNNIEIIVVDVILRNPIRVICVYRPPNSNLFASQYLVKSLTNFINERTILVGDFNLPKITWDGLISTNTIDKLFIEFVQNFELTQHVSFPTRDSNILDLCLSNFICVSQCYPCLGVSDHQAVIIELSLKFPKQPKKYIRDYSGLNLEFLNLEFVKKFPNSLIYAYTVEQKYDSFISSIKEIHDQFIPLIPISTKIRIYPRFIKALIDKKKYLWKACKFDPNRYKQSYKSYSNFLKSFLINYNNQKMLKLLKTPKALHSFIRSKTKVVDTIPTLSYQSKDVTSDRDKAQIFAKIFAQSFANVVDTSYTPSLGTESIKVKLEDINFTVDKVSDLLENLPHKVNTTPDGLTSIILKKCHPTLSSTVTEIFRLSLDSGVVPSLWKSSIIVPIPKSGDAHNPINYRPISLTCTTCKVFEKIVATEITNHMLNNDLIHKQQFGFLPSRSTVTQLIACMEDFYNSIYAKECIDIIYVDLKKAFDSVPIALLIYKLYHYGVRGKILNWIREFLSDRTFTVKVNDSYSKSQPVLSGVPQGSCLGPLLFLIYINDLPLNIPPSITIRMFADDLKIYTTHNNDDKVIDLQNALNSIVRWSNTWKLSINSLKTFVLRIGKNNSSYRYTIDLEAIKTTDEIRDLGILLNSKLDFTSHISKIIRIGFFKSRQLLRVLRSNSPNVWSIAYKSYVRPHLEYATEIWSPSSKNLIAKIERIQKFFTRRAAKRCGKGYLPYSERLKLFKLQSLETRRKILDLTTFFKLCKSLTHLEPSEFITFSSRPKRKHDFQIVLKHRDNKTQHSFIHRNSNTWNNLSKEIVHSQTILEFKQKITNYFGTLGHD